MKVINLIKKSFTYLNEYPKIRSMIIIMLIFLCIILLVKYLSKPENTLDKSSLNIPSRPRNLHDTASAYRKTEYDKLVKISQNKQLEKAEDSGKSLVVGSKTSTSINTEPAMNSTEKRLSTLTKSKTFENIVKRNNVQTQYAPIKELEKNKLSSYDDIQKKQEIQITENRMKQQLDRYAQSWSNTTVQESISANASNQNVANGLLDNNIQKNKTVIVKSGVIIYAVLNTELNSDQPGTPVMATIIQGKYKGAKLLGSFKRENDKLVIQFTSMSMASMNSSLKIKAYAIDPATAQNAMASNVNYHYLLRYGSLFAAAFLQGFGNYFSNTSSDLCSGTSTCIITGDNSTDSTQQTTEKAIYSGLGQIGSNLSSSVKSNFNKSPTVILNKGTGMGILFMQDVTQ